MHLDDRLATVLRHRASGARAAGTQFRQLLDLLGSRRQGRDGSLLAAAWLRLAALGESIPAGERAAMIREPGLRFRNPELALHLAEDEPEVAAAALGAANLSEDDWDAVVPRLPIRARGFLRLRRDLPEDTRALLDRLGVSDRGLPRPASMADVVDLTDEAPAPAPAPIPLRPVPANDLAGDDEAPPSAPVHDDSEIGALVKRIEAYRKTRGPRGSDEAPRLPLGEQPAESRPQLAGFAFTTDAEGRIDWADAGAGPMVVGALLLPAAHAARDRRPIARAAYRWDGAPQVAGDWVIDAAPRFSTPDGRFTGYAGRFRRPPPALSAPPAPDPAADRMRQLLHELKNPVNAVQGYAEMIQQQLFGPTPHEYRALAAAIAGDAARILAGFNELDRLARLETGALELEAGTADVGAIFGGLAEQLGAVMRTRGAAFALDLPAETARVAVGAHEIEALAWRILATVTGAAGTGETVPLAITPEARGLRIACGLPASLAKTGDVFANAARAGGGAVSAGMFGAGFALRLARAEARSAGGDLVRDGDALVLTLPRLTAAEADPSQPAVGSAAG